MSPRRAKSIFQIHPDHEGYPDQWFLDEPVNMMGDEIDEREFTRAALYVGPLPARVPVYKAGRVLAFNLAAFDMPVVSGGVAEALSRIAPHDVQMFSVEVDGMQERYHIVNALRSFDCLDEARSEFTRWKEEDGEADRIGQYHTIATIRIDPARTGNHHIFRIKNWHVALLVSGAVKDKLAPIPGLGIVFERAS
jgi:hypothetical protein